MLYWIKNTLDWYFISYFEGLVLWPGIIPGSIRDAVWGPKNQTWNQHIRQVPYPLLLSLSTRFIFLRLIMHFYFLKGLYYVHEYSPQFDFFTICTIWKSFCFLYLHEIRIYKTHIISWVKNERHGHNGEFLKSQ